MGDAGKVARLLFSSIFPKPSDYFFFALLEQTYEQVLLLANEVVRKLAMNVGKELVLPPFKMPTPQNFPLPA